MLKTVIGTMNMAKRMMSTLNGMMSAGNGAGAGDEGGLGPDGRDFLRLGGMTGTASMTMKKEKRRQGFKSSISLPAELAEFVDEEMLRDGDRNRSRVIRKALRLLRLSKARKRALVAKALAAAAAAGGEL